MLHWKWRHLSSWAKWFDCLKNVCKNGCFQVSILDSTQATGHFGNHSSCLGTQQNSMVSVSEKLFPDDSCQLTTVQCSFKNGLTKGVFGALGSHATTPSSISLNRGWEGLPRGGFAVRYLLCKNRSKKFQEFEVWPQACNEEWLQGSNF